MKNLILTWGFLLATLAAYGQILPSAQRQEVLNREAESSASPGTVKVVTNYNPNKIAAVKLVPKKNKIRIINEYIDNVKVNLFWDKDRHPRQELLLLSGKVTDVPFYEHCKTLIIFNSRKYYCTNELNPGKNYRVIWDAKSNCYCIAEYQ